MIISAASTEGAGGVTVLYPEKIESPRPYSTRDRDNLIRGIRKKKDRKKYRNHLNSFVGAILQPGDTLYNLCRSNR